MAESRLRSLTAAGELANPELFSDKLTVEVELLLHDASAHGTKVSAWDAIQGKLFEAQLAWKSRVLPEFVGLHRLNRSKFGVAGADSHAHGADIITAGFSWRKASDAKAIEADAADAAQKEFNISLTSLSDRLIPELKQLKVLSIGGSHTNVLLRALKAKCRTSVERLRDPSGRLDPDMLTLRSPALKDAINGGLEWCIIHKDVPKIWPELVDVVQQALNTEARGGQSEIEVTMAMHVLMENAIRENKPPKWSQITKTAGYSMPACSPYLNVLAEFVKLNSGGGELLEDIASFQKTPSADGSVQTQTSKRVSGSLFYAKVSGMTFGIATKCPYVQTALVKTNLVSPKNKVVDNLCQLILPSHIASFTSKANLERTLNIEKILAEGRKLAADLGHNLPRDVRVRAVGQLDARMITHVLKLGKQLEGVEFADMGAILQAQLLQQYHHPTHSPDTSNTCL